MIFHVTYQGQNQAISGKIALHALHNLLPDSWRRPAASLKHCIWSTELLVTYNIHIVPSDKEPKRKVTMGTFNKKKCIGSCIWIAEKR